MQTPGSEPSPERASQVCTSCKTRKRKCNKALPKCSWCSKKNSRCDYSGTEQNRSLAPLPLWYGPPVEESQADVQSIDLPTLMFLDPDILQHGQVEIPPVTSQVPPLILHLLGDIEEIRSTASKFFETVHLWMPFVSKKRFYELHFRASFQTRPDVVLLLLSLKLITTFPPKEPRNARTPLYHALKHFHLEVEGSGVFSVLVLQAGVLLSLYELSHAIYPAAFTTIGTCARYAHALGINCSERLSRTKVLTFVEAEEKKRIWWAIVILDRFVSIGCPGRPFATADPSIDDLLPIQDAEWDQGIVCSDDMFTLSSPMNSHMSKFGLLCQAARLLGQVLRYVSSGTEIYDDFWKQLDRTLQAMLTASLNVVPPDNDQITFIYSTLVTLHSPWLHSNTVNEFDTDRFQGARTVYEQIMQRMSRNLVEDNCFFGRDPEGLSPWGLYLSYRICVAHMKSDHRTPESEKVVKGLKETFILIDIRWNAAGAYLQLLEAQEVMSKF